MSDGGAGLAEFLAHSLELESEARERYGELAEIMRSHNNTEVADFFRQMMVESGKHLEEVEALAATIDLPAIRPWEFSWPDQEPPETASYEALHYRMSLAEAIALALANERAAKQYYARVAELSQESGTAALAAGFAEEEAVHEAALQAMLDALPETAAWHRVEDDEPHMPE